ncbi:MAG: long-chain fatty acid--CoA ligase [Deltaproteobacteria bacterium]|nr:long-chain fatty acid--CoA ligase [Deltaproteobacteria bacterium]
MNIFDSLERANIYFPNRPAILFKGKSTSYHELYDRVLQLSSALKARLDLQKGDRVAIFLPNVPEFLVAYYAIARVGAIAVSLNVMLKRNEVQFILNDSGARALITASHLREQLPETGRVPSLQAVVAVDGEAPGLISLQDLLSGSISAMASKVSLEPHEEAAILYTSGTTGAPKGVLLTHGNVVSNVYATNHHTRMEPNDRLMCYLPLFHCFGQNFIMNASVNAGAMLILHERFVPDEILESVKTNQGSMFFGVPTVYLRFLRQPGIEPNFESVRYFFSAAAPMPVEVARSWRERFGRVIYEGYGLTETSPFASYNHDFFYREGSVGTPIENVEIKIIDDQGEELPPGEIGQIAIKGPNVMKGYYRRPEETAQSIRNGWFFTGDIGRVDQGGYVYLIDRAKDMVNVAGFKVWPREVEDILLEHPAVGEVAVIGVPDTDSGEAVKAFVVLKENNLAREQDLIEFCRDCIAVYKAPRFIEFVDALPKSPAGKVLKKELRARREQKSAA